MHDSIYELWLNLYIVAAIAVVGPIMMLLMDRLVEGAVASGRLERASAAPNNRTTLEDLRFMASFVLFTGLLATSAQFVIFHGRSIPIDFGVHPFEMLWFTTALMLLVDTNGFFWHLFSHRNMGAFRMFHSGHHRTKGRVYIAAAFHSNTLWDYPLHSGILLSVGLSLLVFVTGHYSVVTIVYATTVYVIGVALMHSGIRETPAVRWTLWIILLPIRIVPTAIRLEDHLRHHAESDCNYGVFFSHWDRLLGTWAP
jgi:sterol desaturase/sphingolipid hydroxylase (fatty acid hydroxylase superfamily)